MNILHILNYAGNGGSETYVKNLIENLTITKCNFFFAYNIEGPLLNDLKQLNIPIFHISMNSAYSIKTALELKKICIANSIDIIHTHFLRENFLSLISVFLGNKVKVVNTRHMLQNNSLVFNFINSRFCISNYCTIAVSKAVKKELIEQGFRKDKIKLIYNGVKAINHIEDFKYNIRKNFNMPTDGVIVVTAARFTKEKGYDFLLKVVKCFNENYSASKVQVNFLLLGEGKLFDNCKKYAEDNNLKNVIFAGFRKDLDEILPQCDIYAAPSKEEALGISLLQGLSYGLPVVATNAKGHADIFNYGNIGSLVSYGDENSFAKELYTLINDKNLYNMYRQNAFNIIKEYFSLDTMLQDTLCEYEKASNSYIDN